MSMFRDRDKDRAGAEAWGGPSRGGGEGANPEWLERVRAQAARRIEEAAQRSDHSDPSRRPWSPPGAAARPPSDRFSDAEEASQVAPASPLPRTIRDDDAEAAAPGQAAPSRPAPPAQEEVSAALARHEDETFAARHRLARERSSLPRRRRLWDAEDESAGPDRQQHGAAPEYPPLGAEEDEDGGSTRGDWLDRIVHQDPGRARPAGARPAASRPPVSPFAARGARPDPAPPADARDDEVAYARAQLARMADLGLADEGPDAEGGGSPNARAKTRVLGFRAAQADDDPFARGGQAAANRGPDFPVGWLIVVDGAGRGASFALTSGVATLGRGDDQTVCLDFGDTAISRSGHASIAFDEETGQFFLGAGAKSNLVRRNGRPVLATEEMENGDEIRLGETTLRLVALCSTGFHWGGDTAGRA